MKGKKTLLSILLGLCVCLTSAVLFTACEKAGNNAASSGDTNSESGDSSTEQTHTHDYMSAITAPTCTEQGFTTYKCDCGDEYIADSINALNHKFANYVSDNNAKCKKDGTETATCDRDGCTETDVRTEENSALEHEFTNYVSDNNATYEKDGTKTAICNRNGCEGTDTVTEEGTKLASGISFKTLSVNGTSVYGKVSNATESFSFISEVTAVGTAKFVVSLDVYGSQQVATKTIPLEIGDNIVYITETVDGEPINVYTVTVRRRPMYEVTFNTNGGTAVQSQMVEEDTILTEPKTTRVGYTITGWDYDFAHPIVESVKMTVNWTVNDEMSNFVFTSTATECSITGIKDKTVTEIIIPDYVTKIGSSAFDNCSSLTDILIPNSVTDIGSNAFRNCVLLIIYCEAESQPEGWESNWNKIYILNDNTVPVVWDCNNNEVADDGYIYTVIDTVRYALKDAEAVVRRQKDVSSIMTIPSNVKYKNNTYSVTSLEDHAFASCDNLTECILPDNVIDIGDYAFAWCSNLKTITLPNQVITLGNSIFLCCSVLKEIVIPDSVLSVGNEAFLYCDNLTSVTIGSGVISIGEKAFLQCVGLLNITVNTNNKAYQSIDGILYSKDGQKIIQYPSGKKETSFILPDSVTTIGMGAFACGAGLTGITIGNNVTAIEAGAFAGCSSLEYITFGKSVKSIDTYAFEECGSLTSITFEGTIAEWDAISKGSNWNSNVPATEVVCSDGTAVI